jgi:energy-coupling factor transport system ATP-binding protein
VVKDGKILMDGPTREILAREEELAEASLRVPQVVAFSNALGKTALSVDELISCTQTDGAQR